MTRTETTPKTSSSAATTRAPRARCARVSSCRCGQVLDQCSLRRCPRCGCAIKSA